MKPFYKASASADWIKEEFPCYTTGATWNGWGTPFFELEDAKKIAETLNAFKDAGSQITYDSKKDIFLLPDTSYPDEIETVEPVTIKINGNDIKTYPLGAYSWCWDVEKTVELVSKPRVK